MAAEDPDPPPYLANAPPFYFKDFQEYEYLHPAGVGRDPTLDDPHVHNIDLREFERCPSRVTATARLDEAFWSAHLSARALAVDVDNWGEAMRKRSRFVDAPRSPAPHFSALPPYWGLSGSSCLAADTAPWCILLSAELLPAPLTHTGWTVWDMLRLRSTCRTLRGGMTHAQFLCANLGLRERVRANDCESRRAGLTRSATLETPLRRLRRQLRACGVRVSRHASWERFPPLRDAGGKPWSASRPTGSPAGPSSEAAAVQPVCSPTLSGGRPSSLSSRPTRTRSKPSR